MAHQLKLYMDAALLEPVRRFSFPRTEIGKSSDITFYVKNTSEKWPVMDIQHENFEKQIKVLDLPQTLRAKQKIKCTVRYSPAINTDDIFTTIVIITGELHIG